MSRAAIPDPLQSLHSPSPLSFPCFWDAREGKPSVGKHEETKIPTLKQRLWTLGSVGKVFSALHYERERIARKNGNRDFVFFLVYLVYTSRRSIFPSLGSLASKLFENVRFEALRIDPNRDDPRYFGTETCERRRITPDPTRHLPRKRNYRGRNCDSCDSFNDSSRDSKTLAAQGIATVSTVFFAYMYYEKKFSAEKSNFIHVMRKNYRKLSLSLIFNDKTISKTISKLSHTIARSFEGSFATECGRKSQTKNAIPLAAPRICGRTPSLIVPKGLLAYLAPPIQGPYRRKSRHTEARDCGISPVCFIASGTRITRVARVTHDCCTCEV